MARRVLDTTYLVQHWRKRKRTPLSDVRADEAEAWAKELIGLQNADAIVTPIYVEFVAGVFDGVIECSDQGQRRRVERGHVGDAVGGDGSVGFEGWATELAQGREAVTHRSRIHGRDEHA